MFIFAATPLKAYSSKKYEQRLYLRGRIMCPLVQ